MPPRDPPECPFMPDHDPTSLEQITLVIQGYEFKLLAPYAPGQTIGQAEAGVLNREWTQAVRTAYQQRIINALATGDGKLSHQDIAKLQVEFQHFADEYSFKALPTRSTDPLTRQKHRIAKQILDIRLNAAGATRQSYGESKYENALSRLMNAPEVIRQAEQALAAAREAADSIAGIGA